MRRQAFHLDLIARPSPNSSPCSRAAFSAITALLRGRRRLGDCEPHAGCAELGHRARDIDPAPTRGGDHTSEDGLAGRGRPMATITASNEEGPFSWLSRNRLCDFRNGSIASLWGRPVLAQSGHRCGLCSEAPTLWMRDPATIAR
jgi:hypothetical protein